MEPGSQITVLCPRDISDLFVYPMGAYQDEYSPHKCKECPAGTVQWEEGKDLCL